MPAKGKTGGKSMGWRRLGVNPKGEKTPVRIHMLRSSSALAYHDERPTRLSQRVARATLECCGCKATYHVGWAQAYMYRPDLCPTCFAKAPKDRAAPQMTDAERAAREAVRVAGYKASARRGRVAAAVGVSAAKLAERDLDTVIAKEALAELAGKHGVAVPVIPELEATSASDPVLSVEEAVQAELANRELARRKLIHFTQRRRPRYLAGWFHIDLAARLERFAEAVIAGKSPRLLIEAPPRHGKSTLSSEDFPPWFFGHYPDAEIIASAYAGSLANEFSRKVQETMRSSDYQMLFNGLTVREGNEAIESWKNSRGGSYLAAGVGGPITGRGAHVLLIEDPYKNREDADSPIVRKKIWDWYTSTAYTRLAPGGGVCIIHTRWHQDDLIGRLRDSMKEAAKVEAETGKWPEDVDKWEVVSYPAIATEDEVFRRAGEALHPERYDLTSLLRIRRTVGPRDWSALYQQNPVPEEGAFFSKDMIKYYTTLPDGKDFVTVDLAISTAQYADYTVFLLWRVDANNDLFLVNAWRERMDAGRIVDTFVNIQHLHTPFVFGVERGAIYEAILPLIEKTIREKGLYQLRVEPISVGNKDKMVRARPIQGRMNQGKVYLKEGAPYLDWLIPEILGFPYGRNDDGVDAMGISGRMVNDVMYVAPPPPPKQSKSWKDRLHRYVSSTGGNTRHPAMSA